MNLDAAILLSNLACLGAALILLLHAGSITGVAKRYQEWLYVAFMYCPMGVFLATFFFGDSPGLCLFSQGLGGLEAILHLLNGFP